MNESKIQRINVLYRKSQNEGLTKEEKEEQKKLRTEYVAAIRGNLKSQLDNVSLLNPDGTITDLSKKDINE